MTDLRLSNDWLRLQVPHSLDKHASVTAKCSGIHLGSGTQIYSVFNNFRVDGNAARDWLNLYQARNYKYGGV